jgi:hypothetical protein
MADPIENGFKAMQAVTEGLPSHELIVAVAKLLAVREAQPCDHPGVLLRMIGDFSDAIGTARKSARRWREMAKLREQVESLSVPDQVVRVVR